MTVAVTVNAPRAVKMALAVIVKMALHDSNDTPSYFRYKTGPALFQTPVGFSRWKVG